ncbi:MAG: enoyl-CoA hydratase-related protein [Ilumatobacteraceae bacterium]
MGGPRTEDRDGVRWITLQRPEKLNAITRDDLAELTGVVRDLPAGTAAVVFQGAGERAFSAGMHVDTFPGLDVAGARAFISELGRFLTLVRTAPVPTICVVRGHCLGGAMELAMACDLRVADTSAVFGMPEIAVGIPSVLDAALLSQYVGLSKAKELLLTGESCPATELAAFGFLNELVEPEALADAVQRTLDRVLPHAGPATAAQKRLFETWHNTGLERSIAASIGEFAEVFGHDATRERIAGYRPQSRVRPPST